MRNSPSEILKIKDEHRIIVDRVKFVGKTSQQTEIGTAN